MTDVVEDIVEDVQVDGEEVTPLAAWIAGFDTNDTVVVLSMLLLFSVAFTGLSVWYFNPRAEYKNTDPLTHLMQDAETLRALQKKQRRRVRKKPTSAGAGAGAGGNAQPGKGDNATTFRDRDRERGAAAEEEATEESQLLPRMAVSTVVAPDNDDASEDDANSDDDGGADPFNSWSGREFDDDDGGRDDESHASRQSKHALSHATSHSNAYQENLKRSLITLLLEGMTMTMHRGATKTPKSVFMTILGDGHGTLKWRSNRMLARNAYTMELVDVRSIEWGKSTPGFLGSAKAQTTPNDVCFSLMGESCTLDLQASSKVERDLLVQGFTLLIGQLKTERREAQERMQEMSGGIYASGGGEDGRHLDV